MATILSYEKTVNTKGGSKDAYTFKLEVIENGTSIENNTSNVTIKTYVKTNGNTWGFYDYDSVYMRAGYTDNRTNTYHQVYNYGFKNLPTNKKGVYMEIGSWTGNIQHKDDGTLASAFTMDFTHTFTASYLPATFSYTSESKNLSTVPRTTACPELNGNVENQYTITLNPASNTFTHTLTYSFQGLTGTIANKTTSKNITWTIPSSFYAKFTGSSSTGTLTLTTYSNNVAVGTSTARLTVNAGTDRCKPVVSAISVVDTLQSTKNLTHNQNCIILGLSTARITPTIRISSANDGNATIAVRKINNHNYTGNYYDEVRISTNVFTVYIQNSRGAAYNSSTKFTYSNYVPYISPTINCEIGRPTPTGDDMAISFSGSAYNGKFGNVGETNTLTIKWYVKEKGAVGDYTLGGTFVSGTDYTVSGNNFSTSQAIELSNPLTEDNKWDYRTQYDFKITVADKAMTNEFLYPIKQGTPVYYWYENEDNENVFRTNGMNIADSFYSNEFPKTLPSGDGTSNSYWNGVRNGWYYHGAGDGVTNMPSNYGIVHKVGNYNHPEGIGEYNILYFAQPAGDMYRASGNTRNITLTWRRIQYCVMNTLFSAEPSVHDNIPLNDDFSNYDYIEVYYGLLSWGNPQKSVKFAPSMTNMVFLNLMYCWSDAQVVISTTALSFSGRSASFAANRTNAIVATASGNQITPYPLGVSRIVGYKY